LLNTEDKREDNEKGKMSRLGEGKFYGSGGREGVVLFQLVGIILLGGRVKGGGGEKDWGGKRGVIGGGHLGSFTHGKSRK